MKELTIHDKALVDIESNCAAKDAEIRKLKALLRESACPNDDAVNLKCVGGQLLKLSMGGYEWENRVRSCEYCTAVKKVLV
jgi:hypothetical protein